VVNAFVNCDLNEQALMKMPPGLKEQGSILGRSLPTKPNYDKGDITRALWIKNGVIALSYVIDIVFAFIARSMRVKEAWESLMLHRSEMNFRYP
jgi:hypothetical protein